MDDVKTKFTGTAKLLIRFDTRLLWQKYRKYILKTDWDFNAGQFPYIAEREIRFESAQDVEMICQQIVFLLQLGFDVSSCRWTLDREDVIENPTIDELCQMDYEFAVKTTPVMDG